MKIFHHDIRLRIGCNDCRNIINLIVHRRINRNGGFDRNRIHSETKHYHEIGFRYRYRP